MKNTNKFIITIILFSLIISSCEKILDINLPDSKKRIVVNGIIDNVNPIKVQISKSKSILDTAKIEFLSSAKVKLYEGTDFIADMSYTEKGYYISDKIAEIGKEYKLRIEYNGLKSVLTKVSLFKKPNVLSIDTLTVTTTEYDYESKQLHYKIKLKDDANTVNFYILSLITRMPKYNEISGEFEGYNEYSSGFSSSDYLFNNEYSDIDYDFEDIKGRVFTDETINGKEHTIEINTYKDSYGIDYAEEGNEEIENPIQQIVRISSISKEFYNFVISYNKNKFAEYDPFSQPVQVYSNIENGLGIVFPRTTTEYSFDLN